MFISPSIEKEAVVPPVVGSVHNDMYGIFSSDKRFNFAEVLAICINEVADSIILAPPDFNPFAWPVERVARTGIPQPRKPDGSRFTGMNGGQTDTYGTPMRPGDVITARSRLSDWHERDGRLGWTLYTTTEIEWRNQDDELVKTRMSIGIRY